MQTATSGSSAERRCDQDSGHLIGPFEVESVLIEHPAVAEAGVIGKPDPGGHGGGQSLRVAQGRLSSRATTLRRELLGFARDAARRGRRAEGNRFLADACRKTRSGKIMRRLLKARELGLPEGDISTLEATG